MRKKKLANGFVETQSIVLKWILAISTKLLLLTHITRNLDDLDTEHCPPGCGANQSGLGCTPYLSDEKGVTVAVQFYYQGGLGPGPFEQHISGSTNPHGLNLWGPNAFFVPAAGPPPGQAPPHPPPPTPGHHQGPVAGVAQNGTVYYHQPPVCHYHTVLLFCNMSVLDTRTGISHGCTQAAHSFNVKSKK